MAHCLSVLEQIPPTTNANRIPKPTYIILYDVIKIHITEQKEAHMAQE